MASEYSLKRNSKGAVLRGQRGGLVRCCCGGGCQRWRAFRGCENPWNGLCGTSINPIDVIFWICEGTRGTTGTAGPLVVPAVGIRINGTCYSPWAEQPAQPPPGATILQEGQFQAALDDGTPISCDLLECNPTPRYVQARLCPGQVCSDPTGCTNKWVCSASVTACVTFQLGPNCYTVSPGIGVPRDQIGPNAEFLEFVPSDWVRPNCCTGSCATPAGCANYSTTIYEGCLTQPIRVAGIVDICCKHSTFSGVFTVDMRHELDTPFGYERQHWYGQATLAPGGVKWLGVFTFEHRRVFPGVDDLQVTTRDLANENILPDTCNLLFGINGPAQQAIGSGTNGLLWGYAHSWAPGPSLSVMTCDGVNDPCVGLQSWNVSESGWSVQIDKTIESPCDHGPGEPFNVLHTFGSVTFQANYGECGRGCGGAAPGPLVPRSVPVMVGEEQRQSSGSCVPCGQCAKIEGEW